MSLGSSFANAPVTQAWVIGTSTLSVLSWAFHFRDMLVLDSKSVFGWSAWRLFTAPLTFSNVPELVLTTLSALFASLLQVSAIALFPTRQFVFSGPSAMIFSVLFQYFMDVPPLAQFKFASIPMNDKVFTYLICLPMLYSQPSSLLSAGIGLLIGMCWRSKSTGMSTVRYPKFITNLVNNTIGTLLGAPGFSSTSASSSNSSSSSSSNSAIVGNQHTPQNPHHFLAHNAPENDQNQNPPFNADAAPRYPQVPPSEGHITTMMNMGFSRDEAIQALTLHDDNVEAAINSLL